jgi:hypothetical protein
MDISLSRALVGTDGGEVGALSQRRGDQRVGRRRPVSETGDSAARDHRVDRRRAEGRLKLDETRRSVALGVEPDTPVARRRGCCDVQFELRSLPQSQAILRGRAERLADAIRFRGDGSALLRDDCQIEGALNAPCDDRALAVTPRQRGGKP